MRVKKPKKFTDMLIEEQRKKNQRIEDLIWNVNATEPKDAPTKSDMKELLSYMKKYEQLKEVIQNMVDRLDEGGEMTLTKDSIIVHALKEAIK